MWLSRPDLRLQTSRCSFGNICLFCQNHRSENRNAAVFRLQCEEIHMSPRSYKTTHPDPQAQAPENAAWEWIPPEGELGACWVELTTSGPH